MNEIKPGMPQLLISQDKPTNATSKPAIETAMDQSGIEVNHHLQSLANMMLATPNAEADEAKVHAIKNRIALGKYEINLDELTDKLFNYHFSTLKSNS